MEPIIAIARHESPEASLARTICVLCDRNALGCACAPLVLEKGEPPDVGTPDRTLHEFMTGVTAYLQPWRIPVRNCWTAAREEE